MINNGKRKIEILMKSILRLFFKFNYLILNKSNPENPWKKKEPIDPEMSNCFSYSIDIDGVHFPILNY